MTVQISRWRIAMAASLLLGAGVLASSVWLSRLARDCEAWFATLPMAPSRVYARSLVLRQGMDPVAAGLSTQLARAGYRLVKGPHVGSGEFAVRPGEWHIGMRPFRHAYGVEAGGRLLLRIDGEGRIQSLEDAEGRGLARALIEPSSIGAVLGPDRRDRLFVPLDEVPTRLVDAILVAEDRRFFEHAGLDLRRVVGSALANLRSGRVAQGGSTITQQLVRNVFLTPERTLWRKLREAIMALLLERQRTKQEILQAYLNEVYLGQDRSAALHGVGLAARRFFGKPVAELELSECALLAGMIRAPSVYSPLRHPQAARERRDLVLRLMREVGRLSEPEYRAAVAAPLRLRQGVPDVLSAPYFVDFLHKRLLARHPGAAFETRDLSIFTTLDLDLQAVAQQVVLKRLESAESRFPALARERSPLQAALLALEPRTGQILAMVGGRSYGDSPFNRATAARRQTGSVFKPVVALAALSRQGDERPPFTLASVLADEPLRLRGPQGHWQPNNHDGRFRGNVTVREALEHSLNVPLVRLGEAIGLGRVISTARRLGIESPLEPVPSLVLGAFELTLLEITRAYAVLAASGARAPLRSTLAVVERDGAPFDLEEVKTLQVFSSGEAYLLTTTLQGGADRGTSAAVRELGYHGAIAAKTGSTDAFRDAWFLGYTPEIVVGVWVGFDDNHVLGLAGSALALPIAVDFLVEVLGPFGAGHFQSPPEIERMRVGIQKGDRCRNVVEFFLVGSVPSGECSSPRAVGGREGSPVTGMADAGARRAR